MSATTMPPPARPAPPPPQYYRGARDDLFALVTGVLPRGRVLELGCGEGRLGARLRARGFEVHGIELQPTAAAIAAGVLDRVHCGDVEQLELDQADGAFDLLLCGDVLEHLRDPWALLARARRLLAPGGTVVASVPNVQYFPVVAGLLRGRFEYGSSGVLDRTHLRFFTRRQAREMFEAAGFAVAAMPAIYPFRHAAVRALAWTLDRLSGGLLRGFLTGQIHVVAHRRP